MQSVGGFGLTLGIMAAVSLLIIIVTIISVVKSGDKLTSFEKKILIFVVVGLCLFAMILYSASHLSLFFTLIS